MILSDTLPHFSQACITEVESISVHKRKPLGQKDHRGGREMKRSDPAPQTTTVLWNLRNRQELRLAAYDARLGRTRADYGCGSAPESHRTFPGFDRACVHIFCYERILLFSCA